MGGIGRCPLEVCWLELFKIKDRFISVSSNRATAGQGGGAGGVAGGCTHTGDPTL